MALGASTDCYDKFVVSSLAQQGFECVWKEKEERGEERLSSRVEGGEQP